MTSFEHVMLGVNGAFATGLHRRYGWKLVAIAGVAAAAPDWDGLTIIVSANLMDHAHRVWGHNIFACVLLGMAVGLLDYRFDLSTRLGLLSAKLLRLSVPVGAFMVRTERNVSTCIVWVCVAIVAALSQLPTDMIVSGTKTFSHWPIKVLWPFSQERWVYPLVRWGDVGVSIVFAGGMFAMLRWKTKLQIVAATTLATMLIYIGFRGIVGY